MNKKIKNKIKAIIYYLSKKFSFIRICYDILEKRMNFQENIYESNLCEDKEGWSFVIITSGKENKVLNKAINLILNEFINEINYEVIIVGPKYTVLDNNEKVTHFIYKELNILPGWITRKKNIGVKMAQYDKVVVCHDYVGLEKGWLKGFQKFEDEFDVCVTRVLLNNGKRARDWVTWDYPDIGPALLPYNKECTKYQYINGTYFVCKRKFYLENKLDESRRWGEGEDIEWSKRIRKLISFKINIYSVVKYLKFKNENEAPYCEKWIKNTEKISDILKDKK